MGFRAVDVIQKLRSFAKNRRDFAKELDDKRMFEAARQAPKTYMGIALDAQRLEELIREASMLEWAADSLEVVHAPMKKDDEDDD